MNFRNIHSLVRPIDPEALAAKCEKIENFELPRLLDESANAPRLFTVLWYLQWVSQPSNYPGGLGKFTSDLIAASAEKIGTAHMLNSKGDNRYSLSAAQAIVEDFPEDEREAMFGATPRFIREMLSGKRPPKELADEFLAAFTPSVAKARCQEVAQKWLARYFIELCELPNVGFRPYASQKWRDEERGAPWYFVNVAGALLDFIEARAEQLRGQLAETEITRLISRWIMKSSEMRKAVMITGKSRFGKTEAIKLNARVSPGRCRLVDTPFSSAISDLLREVAKCLGLFVKPGRAHCSDLRDRIDYVLRFSRLQLIFDEATFLLPAVFSRNATPVRLNWVRRAIMDKDVPVVFVCTPQSYRPAKKQFVKASGFAMEQFDERVLDVELPDELSEKDLMAVARIHLPDVDEKYRAFVVSQVVATERNFMSDIGKIAFLAKDNAREHGRKTPKLEDFEAAMAAVLPSIAKRPLQPAGKRFAAPVQSPRSSSASPLPPPRRGLETFSRDRAERLVEEEPA